MEPTKVTPSIDLEKETDLDDIKNEEVKMVPYSSLFRFATRTDTARLWTGIVSAIGVGASVPLMFIVFGNMTDQFVDIGRYANCFNATTDYTPAPPSCPFNLWAQENPNCLPYANDYDATNKCNQVYDDGISLATDALAVSCKRITNTWPEDFKESDDSIVIPIPDGILAFNCAELKHQDDSDKLYFCYNTVSCESYLNETHEQVTDGLRTDFMAQMKSYTLYYCYLGLATWILAWMQTSFLMLQANDQINFIRKKYFECILRQDIGFFDTNSVGELNTRSTEDIKKMSDGMGDKIGISAQSLARFATGMGIAFYYGWELALVILSIAPILMISASVMFKITSSYTKKELDAYAAAGAVAEEVLNSIKTVTAFGGQADEAVRYNKFLVNAKKVGIKRGVATGLSVGTLFLVLFCAYGLAFWYGGKLVADPDKDYTIGNVMVVFFGVLTGAFSLSAVGQNMEYFGSARAAAHAIYDIIDREPPIDVFYKGGLQPKYIESTVKLSNISFTYPARLDHKVLRNVSFEAAEGKTIALCGQSGCGKSTCIQLIQRFYDPQEGSVEIGGHDITKLNVHYLRNLIGVVSQEPSLFQCSVIENIRYGRTDVTDEQIYEAAKQANAFDFIESLPKKWDTFVGEGGATLSGGQKQRVAITRALVRNPKILLLDEATSALDTESEAIVQSALEKATKGRTTIVIAHRLSTIKNADLIIGFANGEVTEQGNHESLMGKENGVYANLCNMQTFDKVDIKKKLSTKREKLEGKEIQTSGSGEKDEKVEEDLPDSTWATILAMNRPELIYIILGVICAAVTGAIQPLFAIIFSEIIAIFSDYADDIDALMDELQFWALMFVAIGAINFFGNFGSMASFSKSGEELTMRLRAKCFKKYLSLEMAYFDDPLNSTGALTTRLATDASRVQGATGSRIGLLVQNVASLGFAFAIAFYYCWQLTLVCLMFVPIMALSGFAAMSIFSGKVAEKERKAYEEAGKISTEATLNIRTVASLAKEYEFYNNYVEQMSVPAKASKKKSILYGIAYGSSQGVIFFAYAGCFYFGTWLIEGGVLPPAEFNSIYKVLMAVVFGAMAVGQSSAFAPDFGEAQLSARRIIKLFNKTSEINPEDTTGKKPKQCFGEVIIKSVEFTYPTRPDIKILKGLSASVKPGETLALVGQSGCGKSTCIQLLERFYNPTDGSILIDNQRIDELNLGWLRQQIGFVQQEPVLFDKTIKENILYGFDDSFGVSNAAYCDETKSNMQMSKTTLEEIERAAREANAYDFITALPSQFNTNCGQKGSQLSGGQKQRIAIARALIRKPKILLLDEATSALDAESEKIVQDALDKARKGRTCIIIAHRLSTVINADKIAVVANGKITELGKHEELLKQKGAYYSLINSQL